MIIPADLDKSTVDQISELAKKAFVTIDGAGLARVDFFLDRNNGHIYLNEINTMPGFTQYSMYPLLWHHTGVSYTELIDRIIQLALLRHDDLNRSESTFFQQN
jgi:D-alanine-D-alanine ligase